jgi:anti-anti-sigma factor
MQDNKLDVKVSIVGDTTGIIHISGELSVFVPDFDLFYREVAAYIRMGLIQFVIDLNGVSYIDSSGIGLIIKLSTNAMRNQTKICLICEQPQVRRALTIANIDRIVHFVSGISEGMEFYRAAETAPTRP